MGGRGGGGGGRQNPTATPEPRGREEGRGRLCAQTDASGCRIEGGGAKKEERKKKVSSPTTSGNTQRAALGLQNSRQGKLQEKKTHTEVERQELGSGERKEERGGGGSRKNDEWNGKPFIMSKPTHVPKSTYLV